MVLDIPVEFSQSGERSIIDAQEKETLRALASRLAELSALPIQAERADLWKRLNRLERVRPPVVVHPWEIIWTEIIPEGTIECHSPEAQYYETVLRRRLWIAENLDDDTIVAPYVEYPTIINDEGLGLPNGEGADIFAKLHETGSRLWKTCIHEKNDIDDITTRPEVSLNVEVTEINRQQAENIFHGVIDIRPSAGTKYNSSFFDTWVKIRGIQEVFMDLALEPAWTHEAFDRLAQNIEYRLLSLERQNLLQLNNGIDYCYNGGMATTDELPASDFDGTHVRLKDLWGHSTAQNAVAISEEMHDEFVIQYEQRLLKVFGLNGLACCEPMDDRIYLARKVPNLRRISMSEWVDPVKGAEALGNEYIYSWKPDIRVHYSVWDPDWERAYIRDVLEKTKGCIIEIAQLAVGTCRGDVSRLSRWSQIAMEEAKRIEGA